MWQLQENSWFAIFQTRDLAILVVMTHLSQGSLSFWLSLVYFLWSLFMLYISYNLSNWSHDWQQISLELGKFLQKKTLSFISFILYTITKGSASTPTLLVVFQNYETLRVIFKHCCLGVAFLIPTWSSIKLLLLPKLLTDVYGKVCILWNIDGVAPGWTKTANFETII